MINDHHTEVLGADPGRELRAARQLLIAPRNTESIRRLAFIADGRHWQRICGAPGKIPRARLVSSRSNASHSVGRSTLTQASLQVMLHGDVGGLRPISLHDAIGSMPTVSPRLRVRRLAPQCSSRS